MQRRRRSPGSGRHEAPHGPAAEPTLRDRPVPSSRSCVDGVFPAMPRFPRGLRGRLLFTRGTTGRAIRRPGPPGSAVPTAPSSELQGVGWHRRLPLRSPGPGRRGRLCRPPPACCPWPSGFLSPACQAQAPQVTPRAFPCPARCRPDFSAPPAHPAAWLSTGAQAQPPMDEASAHPRASPRLCHRNAPTWAANLSLPPGRCAHPRPGHTSRPWSAERVVRPLPTSPVSFHTLRHIRFSSVPQMHHEPLAPRGLCTCKPLWFGFPRPPYALLILPPSSPLVKLQHRFFRGPSLAHGTGYLLA